MTSDKENSSKNYDCSGEFGVENFKKYNIYTICIKSHTDYNFSFRFSRTSYNNTVLILYR